MPLIARIADLARVGRLAAAAAAHAEHPAITRAESAVESKNVDPARDIAPLLDALKRSKDVDEKRELVDTISDLGEADGESPNSVKQYLMQNAPPVLLEVAKTGNNAFLQGDAITALREMGCSRAILEQAAAIAEADPDSFVQSRGEILRNYIKSMPVEDDGDDRPRPPTRRRRPRASPTSTSGASRSRPTRCATPPGAPTPSRSRRCSTPASRPTPAPPTPRRRRSTSRSPRPATPRAPRPTGWCRP